jgi:hypothetical protein
MITNSAYDLFYFDQNFYDGTETPGEWRNYKYYMENGMEFKAPYNAYLYANKQNTTLNFTGNLYTAGSVVYQRITFNGDADEVGVNLVGNPYTCNAEMVAGNRIGGYYMLNEERNDVIVYDDGEFDYTYLAPMTAFFAVASANNNNAKITLSPLDAESHDGEEPGIIRSNESTMSIELTANGILKDRVYVKAGEGENCIKFNLNNNSTKLYFTQGNTDYVVVRSEGKGELPVSFKAESDGNYVLSISNEGVSFAYLHLIDNLTGADVDLLANPTPETEAPEPVEGPTVKATYTFESQTGDFAKRFTITYEVK